MELLLAMSVLGVLTSVVIIALNPSKQLADAGNGKRKTMVRAQENAVMQYIVANSAMPVTGIPTTEAAAKPICRGAADPSCIVLSNIAPTYLVSLPVDSLETGTVVTGYRIYLDNAQRARVCSDYLPTGDSNRCSASTYVAAGGGSTGGAPTGPIGTTNLGYLLRLDSTGAIDSNYQTLNGTAFNAAPVSIAMQSDDHAVVSGTFSNFGMTAVRRLVRILKTGGYDLAFNTTIGTGPSSAVNGIAIQPSNGAMLLGGSFLTFNGSQVHGIARVNSQGTLDFSFLASTGAGTTGGIGGTAYTIAVQPDGKILIGGLFTSLNGITQNRITRLNTNGSIDATFLQGSGFNGRVNAIAVQPDGKILIGGSFSSFNGIPAISLVRLNSNGTLDCASYSGSICTSGFMSYMANGPNGAVLTIALQPDGKILVGGSYTTFSAWTVNNLFRLNADGTMDNSFYTQTSPGGLNGQVKAIKVQSDGKILVGGSFTTFKGLTANRLMRMESTGAVDSAFMTNQGAGLNGDVNGIGIQSDGKIVIVGGMTRFN